MLVWNRLRYSKDPDTGRRISKLNPPEAWTRTEVPDLRIIDSQLWETVKRRQGQIRSSPGVEKIRKSGFWEQRRAPYLLTGRSTVRSAAAPTSRWGGRLPGLQLGTPEGRMR